MEKQNYSSKMVEDLMENENFNFWAKDYSKLIIVHWKAKVPLKKFRNDIVDLVGKNFMFEPSLNSGPVQFIVTTNGLVKA